MRLSMSTKVPDSGRSDQRVSPVTWNSTIRPLPRRAAVTSGVPSASVAQVFSLSAASGSASTCRLTVTSFGHRHAVERALARKRGQRLRLVPAQAAAEDAAAAPQPHRNEIVVGGGKPRAGKAHQHAAVVDPVREPVMGVAGDIADVGEDQHRQILIEEMRHRFGRRFALREPHVGERAERALDVIARRQQRLRRVGGGAGNDADGAAAPALVEQLHGAGGALAGDLDARDVVADFDRQIELRFGLAIAGLNANGASPSGRPLRSSARTVPVSALPDRRAAPSRSARRRHCRRR